jgi:lysophospholipase
MFPGRTEYIEKYGRVAAEFAKRGYAFAAIDWRGQGLADRPEKDSKMGHVEAFSDYQLDVAAMVHEVKAQGLPEPYYLVGHSMGGCIGLRALLSGLPVKAAAFSAPMWGIHFATGIQPVARALSRTARLFGQALYYAPGTNGATYVLSAPFMGNLLTRDAEAYGWMQEQMRQQPDLSLGGPSLHWLDEAMNECMDLAEQASPDIPTLCFLGLQEKIVDTFAIHNRMERWPKGKLELVAEAEHEVMMEVPATRDRFYDGAVALFQANR